MALALGLGPAAYAFTFEDLRTLIESQNLTRIEDVVERLPEEYRQNYTLMHASRSLQEATPAFPRAILFGKNASLILAFGGSPDLVGYDSLEVIQYRDQSHQFEFRRILFHETSAGKRPEFSPANPTACLSCHTTRLRPNWERYPDWPGAYGSFDDFPNPTELANLKSFWETNGKKGRYRSLTHQAGSEATPYEIKSRGRLQFRPNFRLAAALFSHQADSVAHFLRALPQGRNWALLFAMSLLKCDTIPVAWGEVLKAWYGSPGIAPLAKWTTPSTSNAYAFLLRGAGISPRTFTTELVLPSGPEDVPYHFHVGLPKDWVEPFDNGVIGLHDHVMSHLLEKWEMPELKNRLVEFRWVEERFKKNPDDVLIARQMDDILRLHNHLTLKGACPDLARAYRP